LVPMGGFYWQMIKGRGPQVRYGALPSLAAITPSNSKGRGPQVRYGALPSLAASTPSNSKGRGPQVRYGALPSLAAITPSNSKGRGPQVRHGARSFFDRELHSRVPLSFTCLLCLKRCQACDHWHSLGRSRPLTVTTVNSVQTLKAYNRSDCDSNPNPNPHPHPNPNPEFRLNTEGPPQPGNAHRRPGANSPRTVPVFLTEFCTRGCH
jgi:hypothetical protein